MLGDKDKHSYLDVSSVKEARRLQRSKDRLRESTFDTAAVSEVIDDVCEPTITTLEMLATLAYQSELGLQFRYHGSY